MSYYVGGDGYFMAGGFGSFFKKVGRGIISVPKRVVQKHLEVSAQMMSLGRTKSLPTAFRQSMQMATGVVGAGGAGGRLGELMNPEASPALASSDGTPPAGPAVVEASQSGLDPNLMMLLILKLLMGR